jgi:hypothetical protein
MATIKKRVDLFGTEKGAEIERRLRMMEADITMKTGSSYSANSVTHPDHKMPFVEKHMAYLNSHPNLDPDHYLGNLRLMLRDRS